MILRYKHLFCTKHMLSIWMVCCFILSCSGVIAGNKGGNDTIASSLKSDISIDKQKVAIRNMTADELTAFIDETFDMDTIPVEIINEINMAVARLEIEKVSETAIVKVLQPKKVLLTVDKRENSFTICDLKAITYIPPAQKKEPLQLLAMRQLTLREIQNEVPISKELVKTVEFTQIREKDVVQSIPVAKQAVIEKTNDIPLAKELVKNRKLTQMKTLKIKPVLIATDNTTGFVPNPQLKAMDIITPAPEKYVVRALPVAKLQATELRDEVTPFNNIVKNKEAMDLVLFQKNTTLLSDDKMNFISINELREIKIIEYTAKADSINTAVDEVNYTVSTETSISCTETHVVKKPTPLDLVKKNALSNTSKVNGTNPPTIVYNVNAPIPSPDYYVSWEINKLFPEKDMLKMKGDTSITLVLLNKEHRRYYHPFNGPITSGFGWRDSTHHNGIDIDLNKGDKVSAAFDGMVRVAKRCGGFGNVVIIRHYNGLETIYAHLSKIKVKPGQLIFAGDLVGLGGSTGHSTGSHLHFEIRFKGVPINPKYLISLSEQKLMCDEFTLKKTKWGLAVYPKNIKLYTVEKGDTVFEIAKRFGTTTASIKELNHLGGGRVRLKAGQQINVAH